MVAKIREIKDEVTPYIDRQGNTSPDNVVTIEEQRKSQARGATGIGLNENSYSQDQEDFNRQGGDGDSEKPETYSEVGGLSFLRGK